jgi:hypothetical protein
VVIIELCENKLGVDIMKTYTSYSGLNIRRGEHSEHGFKYYPSINKSILGMDARYCALITSKIAHHHKISIDITFIWSDDGLHPNKHGRICV